jgi:nucleotide-binding universal stress UspA family protein
MERTVLAVLDHPDAVPDLLAAAARLLVLIDGGVLRVLVVRMPPLAAIMPTEEVLTVEHEAEIRAHEVELAEQLRAGFELAVPAMQRQGIKAAWTDVEADLSQAVAEYGGRAEAVVVSQPGAQTGARTRQIVHAALFDTGKPVLLVHAGGAADFGRTVAVAWKDDGRARNAVLSALPILRRAERVHILRLSEAEDAPLAMPPLLVAPGFATELHVLPTAAGSMGERILAAAHECGADLLVMGAYGHGEWREALFGGATRHMLRHADLPVWQQH